MTQKTLVGQSQRQLRVGEQLRHILVETLQRGHFHNEILLRDAALVTVTEVQVTSDLKTATAYVIRLGGGDMKELLTALNETATVFQKEFAHQMRMKFTPRLRFMEDSSFDKAAKIESILHNLPKPAES
jgi:ribosome-binding factor A